MPISLQSDAVLPQGHILIDGQRVASFSTTGGLSATLNQDMINSITQPFYQIPGAFSFRNKIINGNFDIWQRGTSFSITAAETYTADRWSATYNGSGGTRTITRQAFDLGQTGVPNEPTYFFRWNQSVAGTGATYNAFRQKIESVRTLANKDIVVTFYAKAASPISVSVYGLQFYGTGGSPSAPTYTNFPGALNITTSWQKFTVNLTVPSIAGKVLGSNNNDWFSIDFALPLNTTFTFDIAQVQIEEGPIATPFEQRPLQTELALCQRYYYNSKPPWNPGGNPLVRQYNDTGGNRTLPISYTLPVPLRIATGLNITVIGDINDGAPFTTWTNIFALDGRTIYADKVVGGGQWLDLHQVIVSAEF